VARTEELERLQNIPEALSQNRQWIAPQIAGEEDQRELPTQDEGAADE
jgi:hypothetical protein